MPRLCAGGSTHPQPYSISRHGVISLAPGKDGSGLASSRRGAVVWIDDSRRSAKATHRDVPISPLTRRPTPERPPSASYSSLALGVGWVDTSGTSFSVAIPRSDGGQTVAHVIPCMSSNVSAAAASQPVSLIGVPSSKIVSICRGTQKWVEQRDRAAAALAAEKQRGADAAPRSADGSVDESPKADASTPRPASSSKATRQQSNLQSADSPFSHSGAGAAAGAGFPGGGGGAGGAAAVPPLSAPPSRGAPVPTALRPPTPSTRLQSQSQSQQLSGTDAASGGRPAASASAEAAPNRLSVAPATGSWNLLSATQGPVRATPSLAQSNASAVSLGRPTPSAPPAQNLSETIANLAAGNMQRSFGGGHAFASVSGDGRQARPGSGGPAHETPTLLSASAAASGGVNGGWVTPAAALNRAASNRVRGYSPGPGKSRDKAGQPPQSPVVFAPAATHDASSRASGVAYYSGRPLSASFSLETGGGGGGVLAAPGAQAFSASSTATKTNSQVPSSFPGVHALPQYQLFTPSRQGDARHVAALLPPQRQGAGLSASAFLPMGGGAGNGNYSLTTGYNPFVPSRYALVANPASSFAPAASSSSATNLRASMRAAENEGGAMAAAGTTRLRPSSASAMTQPRTAVASSASRTVARPSSATLSSTYSGVQLSNTGANVWPGFRGSSSGRR